MRKKKLAYLWSMRNAAADRAGQSIPYKGGARYMTSPLEHLCHALDTTALGDAYALVAVICDDDAASVRDQIALRDFSFDPVPGRPWFYPQVLTVQGKRLNSLLRTVPSSYRRLPLHDSERSCQKQVFEQTLLNELLAVQADWVVIDGLLIILDALVRPGSPYARKMFNIHPGITRSGSPFERRGAHATWDALYGARGLQVVDWASGMTRPVPRVDKTGASFHYVDQGIDSGEVIVDVLQTDIDPEDTILELRWNNFQRSLFPALTQGLARVAGLSAVHDPFHASAAPA